MPLAPASSPCVDVCRLRPATGLCEGCLRTVGEITEWRGASEARRRQILAEVAARRNFDAAPSTASSPQAPAVPEAEARNLTRALFPRVESD